MLNVGCSCELLPIEAIGAKVGEDPPVVIENVRVLHDFGPVGLLESASLGIVDIENTLKSMVVGVPGHHDMTALLHAGNGGKSSRKNVDVGTIPSVILDFAPVQNVGKPKHISATNGRPMRNTRDGHEFNSAFHRVDV
jgi:hypothetical protein